jgi:hypothetical protein
VLEYWSIERIENWSTGAMEYWDIGKFLNPIV